VRLPWRRTRERPVRRPTFSLFAKCRVTPQVHARALAPCQRASLPIAFYMRAPALPASAPFMSRFESEGKFQLTRMRPPMLADVFVPVEPEAFEAVNRRRRRSVH
jgi:hypothetical protein